MRKWLGAETFSCQRSECPNRASCEGDVYSDDGCKRQCWVYGPGAGEISRVGSACCAAGGDCDELIEG
jgi:hypothetical protein